MKVFETSLVLNEILDKARAEGLTIGFVPTMGALHDGHISLVECSKKRDDLTVVSVYLNPTQFNNKKDFDTYPRTLEHDVELLKLAGADYVFTPADDEIYPKPDKRFFDFGSITTVMEGEKRPGHFNGVCQVVSRLFEIIKPDRSYFGEKDFQQIAVIRALVEYLKSDVEIVACPIVREQSGLAMSSRNERLSKEERLLGANIYKVLSGSKKLMKSKTVGGVRDYVISSINSFNGLKVEYYQIVNGRTLFEVKKWNEADDIVGCITVYCGENEVRLIDNIRYK